MIEVRNYIELKEIVPQEELNAWKATIAKVNIDNCPKEVVEFIEALAAKMEDFVQIKKFNTLMTGYELLLGGMKEVNGEAINPWEVYPTPVPHMIAADHRAAMYRIFNRRGKQGLIDFCRAKVKATEQERILQILNVHVFDQARPEFMKVMAEINASKKIESRIDV